MSSLDNTGMVMSSMMSQLSDHLITDPYSYIMESGSSVANNVFNKDPEVYLDFLENWDFVQGLVDTFVSPLKEIITKNTIRISFEDENLVPYESVVNSHLESLEITKVLSDSLFDIVYRGGFFKYLMYNKETQEFHFLDVEKPWKTVYVTKLGSPMGYLRNSKFVSIEKGVYASYYSIVKRRITLDKITSSSVKKAVTRDLGDKIPKDLEKEITIYVHSIARSVFYGQASKLFQIFLNDIIAMFLALKDSVRQDLVSVLVSSLPKKTINAAKVVQSIEEAANQGSTILTQQDPVSLLNQVIYTLFNNVRVLPMIENYSSVTKLDLVDLKDKRIQLQAENDELKKQVISNLSIPEELQSGTGNRWEILSRSDKFLTAINSYVSMCDSVVKQVVISILETLGVDEVSQRDVKFTFINNTPLQSQMSRSKATLFIDSIRDSINAINGYKAIIATGFVDPNKAIVDFLDQVQSWSLPFSSSYLSAEQINQAMMDPNNPASNILPIDMSELQGDDTR